MSPEQLEISLHKLFSSLFFKGRVKFRVQVSEIIDPEYEEDNELIYHIDVFVTVDHSKYWAHSPNYESGYSDYIQKISDDADYLESLCKYVITNGSVYLNIFYEHYNTDTYQELLDYIGELNVDFTIYFSENMPYPEITLDENIDRDPFREGGENSMINNQFDTDDILLVWDEL